MVNDKSLKQRVKTLRKRGLSYGDIAKKTRISKSTVKYWCDGIILNPKDRERLYTKQIQMLSKGPSSSRSRRQIEIQEITDNSEKEIDFPLHQDSYKLFGAALYWAEGNKINDFTITNSDPLLIQFMTQWFCKMFDIKPNDLKAHLNIYKQQNEVEIKKFWSEITKIPLNKFGKTFVKPTNKNYKKNTLYYGTIKIRVTKGTNFRHRVFGWINAVLKNVKINVGITERKWYKLKGDYSRP